MRRYLIYCFVVAALLLSVQPQFALGPNGYPAMLKAKAENVPEITAELVPNFLNDTPQELAQAQTQLAAVQKHSDETRRSDQRRCNRIKRAP